MDKQPDQHAYAKAVHIGQAAKVKYDRPEITLNGLLISLIEHLPGKCADFPLDIYHIGQWAGLADFGGELLFGHGDLLLAFANS
jgi:hypothetical protein